MQTEFTKKRKERFSLKPGQSAHIKIDIPLDQIPENIRELLKDIEGNKEKIIAMGGLKAKVRLQGETNGKPIELEAMIDFSTGQVTMLDPDNVIEITDPKVEYKKK